MKKGIPLEQRYLKRKPGGLQIRAAALESALDEHTGAPLVMSIAKTCRHTGQLVLDSIEEGLPFVRSLENAVPVLNPTAKRAREINSKGPETTLLDPARAVAERIPHKS